MNLQNQNLQKYWNQGFNNVQGFCAPELIKFIDHLDALPINKRGGVCEIGVHHGQYYIMLNQVIPFYESSYAIDVFDLQHLNIDKSGEGNLKTFKENLQNYDIHKGENTTIVQGDSTDTKLNLTNYIEPGSIRFFSIDGGHTAEHAINDLHIANQLIANEGIVIVDDIMHHWWPGVLEGLVKFIENKPTLIPVAMGYNKMYLCKMSFHQYYIEQFLNFDLPSPRDKRKFFGYDIAVFKYWHMMSF
jgi:hypothetical protein